MEDDDDLSDSQLSDPDDFQQINYKKRRKKNKIK